MRVQANGIAIEVDVRGPPDGEPLLLIMGLGMQLVAWPDALVDDLVARGFRVIRFDNRDIGLSQRLDELGTPSLAWAALRHAMHWPVSAPYALADMARDALGVLDALGVARAHVCGASLGGMVAQHVAARAPQRVKSLVLMMTSSGARALPGPTARARRALMTRPRSARIEDLVAHLQGVFGVIGSPAYAPDPQRFRARLREAVQRSWHPAGVARQLLAVIADGDRSALLARIAAPTCIVHGRADPLIPAAAAHDLARRIAGAHVELIDGMGHDLPDALLPRLAAAIATNAARSQA